MFTSEINNLGNVVELGKDLGKMVKIEPDHQ